MQAAAAALHPAPVVLVAGTNAVPVPLLPLKAMAGGHAVLGVAVGLAVRLGVREAVALALAVREPVLLAVAPKEMEPEGVLVALTVAVRLLVAERVAVLLDVGVLLGVKNSEGVGVALPVRLEETEEVSEGVAPAEPVMEGLAVLLAVMVLEGVGGM